MSLGLKTLPDALALRPAPLLVARLLAVLFSRLPDILLQMNSVEMDVEIGDLALGFRFCCFVNLGFLVECYVSS